MINRSQVRWSGYDWERNRFCVGLLIVEYSKVKNKEWFGSHVRRNWLIDSKDKDCENQDLGKMKT